MRDQSPGAQNRNRLFDIESPLAIELRRIMIRLGRSVDFERRRCLMVTSAQRGEGKSLFSSHFALVLAHHMKKRVLLVDGDLRRPVQHVVYQVPRGPGFAEQLRGEPFAPRPLGPAESRSAAGGRRRRGHQPAARCRRRCSAAVERWKQEYDIVVLDSPPVVPVSDPLQYVDAVDGVIYLVMAGRTSRDIVVRGRADPAGGRRQHSRRRGQQFLRGAAVLPRPQVLRVRRAQGAAAREVAQPPTPGGGIDGAAPGPQGSGGGAADPGAEVLRRPSS